MIKAIIGAGGSGKSLYFIRYLFSEVDTYELEVINGKEKEIHKKKPVHSLYGRLILNIKGFNEDLFREYSGNYEIEIIHESKHWNKDDIQRIFKFQEKEENKPEDERISTLLIYDECQFGLSTFSQAQALLEQNEYIANFMSLHRHYGPCDIFLATQSADKIHGKFVGDLDELYLSLESNQKLDPENDIVFDQYDKDGRSIISGGRSKIKFKKLDKLKKANGEEFLPFELYTSGDAGRRPVKRKSFWGKYIYYFVGLLVLIIGTAIYVFFGLFDNMNKTVEQIKDKKAPVVKSTSPPPKHDSNISQVVEEVHTQFDRYMEAPYHNIDAQVLYRVFCSKQKCYLGKQVISLYRLNKLIDENYIFRVSTQHITSNAKYVNVLIHQSLLNSYQLVNNFDNTAEHKVNINSNQGRKLF